MFRYGCLDMGEDPMHELSQIESNGSSFTNLLLSINPFDAIGSSVATNSTQQILVENTCATVSMAEGILKVKSSVLGSFD